MHLGQHETNLQNSQPLKWFSLETDPSETGKPSNFAKHSTNPSQKPQFRKHADYIRHFNNNHNNNKY